MAVRGLADLKHAFRFVVDLRRVLDSEVTLEQELELASDPVAVVSGCTRTWAESEAKPASDFPGTCEVVDRCDVEWEASALPISLTLMPPGHIFQEHAPEVLQEAIGGREH